LINEVSADYLRRYRGLHQFPVETRADFSARLFNQDLRAYILLQSMQGKYIAKFLGHFTIKFEQRELPEDQSCKVLMLEFLEGRCLEIFPIINLSSLERALIRQNVLDIATSVYEHGIFFPSLSLSNFLVLSADRSLRIFGFSVTYDPDKVPLVGEDKKSHIKRVIERLKFELDDLGYT
jgi:hypothetical protein